MTDGGFRDSDEDEGPRTAAPCAVGAYPPPNGPPSRHMANPRPRASVGRPVAGLEDRDVGCIDLILRVDLDHPRHPLNVPDLLLAELNPSVEDAKVILLLEGQLVEVDIRLVDEVLDRLELILASAARISVFLVIELLDLHVEAQVLFVVLEHLLHARVALAELLCPELLHPLGVEVAKVREEGVPFFYHLALAQWPIHGVKDHHQDPEVSLCLENVPHDLRGGATDAHDELVEVLQPRALQVLLHDLEVLVLQHAVHAHARPRVSAATRHGVGHEDALVRLSVLFCRLVLKLLQVLLEVWANGGVDQEDPVHVVHALRGVVIAVRHDRVDASKDAHGMELLQHLAGLLVVHGILDDHDNVLNHLLAREKMIENVVMIIQNSMNNKKPSEMLEKLHPMGVFAGINTIMADRYDHTAKGVDDMYRIFLVDTPIGPYFEKYLQQLEHEAAKENAEAHQGVFVPDAVPGGGTDARPGVGVDRV